MDHDAVYQEIAATLRQLAGHFEQLAARGGAPAFAATFDASPSGTRATSVGTACIGSSGPGGEPSVDLPQVPTIEAALAALGIQVQFVPEVGAGEEALAPMAAHIANTWPRCVPLLSALKRAQGTTHGVRLDLKKHSQLDISAITTLGSLGARAQLLPGYRYRSAPVKALYCGAPVTPMAIRFFTGGWLELHAYAELAGVAQEAGWRIEPRVNVMLPNEDQFELDIAMVGPSGQIVWLEAKTGNGFANLMPKYRHLTKTLGTGPRYAFLLAPELSDSELTVAATSASMTPVTLEDFVDVITGRLL